MGAEIGATTSIFPYGGRMRKYLQATGTLYILLIRTISQVFKSFFLTVSILFLHLGRGEVAAEADKYQGLLTPDSGAPYDQIVDIDLNTLEPHVNGPFTPDLAHPISQLGEK